MKVWISRWALTEGIVEGTLEKPEEWTSGEKYVSIKGRWNSLRIGKDVHATREEAVKRAEQMRTAKIASLSKQITAMRLLVFGDAPTSSPRGRKG